MADNIIKVNVTANKTQRVTVSSANVGTEITASSDTGKFWAQNAKNWAVSESIVDNKDYSSKYYANKSKGYAQNAESFEAAARDIYNNFLDNSTEAIENVQGARDEAITNIETSRVEAIDSINSTKTTILNDIEFIADGEKQEIEELIDSGKEELKESIGDVKILTTLEIGDIGFTQMAIDESKGKRRILNGQLIIQDQYVQFTNIIKNSVALNPDLACTEAEWQTAVTMSTNGVCYKYVIDDEAGTIRLPKYPEYLDLSINGAKTVSVYGNGKTLGLTDGSNFAGSVILSGVGIDTRTPLYGTSIGTQTSGNSGLSLNKGIGVTKDASKSGLTGSVTTSSEQIKGTYFIQVATGAETKDNIINEIELNNPFFLGMSQYFETAPNNSSWLKSEGQWNAKAVYPTVYDWALINANNSIEGFKLVTDTYTDYDYVINTAEETFRLPLLNGSEDLPSDKYIDLTLEASGSSYTAPANGWYFLRKLGSSGQYISLGVDTRFKTAVASQSSTTLTLECFVKRGEIVTNTYSASGDLKYFRFIYAQGNGSLYFYVGAVAQNAPIVNLGRIQETYTTKSMVDGQWVESNLRIVSKTFTSGESVTVDLSDYLPNDGYSYEVMFSGTGNTIKESGADLDVKISTDILQNGKYFLGCRAFSTSVAAYSVNTITLPVGVSRRAVITHTATKTTGLVSIYVTAYRRIGTNL